MSGFFSQSDIDRFQNWLNLNWEGITWEGRYNRDFLRFWDLLFAGDPHLTLLIERFQLLRKYTSSGPLATWLTWLEEKLVAFCFIKKDLNILELSAQTKEAPSKTAFLLRDFFIDVYPYLDEYFNTLFSIGNVSSEKLTVSFSEIKNEIDTSRLSTGVFDEDVMRGLEVTLYPDWQRLVAQLEKVVGADNIDLRKVDRKKSVLSQLRFFQEVVVFFSIGALLLVSIRYLNQYYEKNLAEKVKIFEPEFSWLDLTKIYKQDKQIDTKKIEAEITDSNKFKKQAEWVEEFRPEERLSTESEVSLISVDELPRTFDYAGLEQSEYEEEQKGGYRDRRYGRNKAYRILMRSEDTPEVREMLDAILRQFDVKKVDNVNPGKEIPGGIYYNLYIPIESLKSFLERVNKVAPSTIYESKTRTANPPGRNKVFIWVKQT